MSTSASKYYIIEHMEADDSTPESLPPWVMLEYSHILERTYHPDHNNTVLYTNLTSTSTSTLERQLRTAPSHSAASASSKDSQQKRPRSNVKCLTESIEKLAGKEGIPSASRICLLDPRAEKVISPEDAQHFDGFLFGGILGDDPPRDRTKELRKLGYEGRHLGSVQMTTDTACYVTSLVIDHGMELDKINYIDHPTIQFNKQESVEMPFRYVVDEATSTPTMPTGMRELLYEDMNKGFEF